MKPEMAIEWIPLANYTGANHVLGAGCCFVHPGNGNQYFWDCVQWGGARQDLNIYRLVAKTGAWEHVVTFEGTKDAQRGFERGQVQIGQGGALIVATTMTPKDVAYVTTTGFQGVRCIIPRIDDPWSGGTTDPRVDALVSQLGALGQQLEALTRRPLTAPAQGGPEGGELVLEGAPGFPAWHIDTVEGQLRIFSAGVGALIVNSEGVWVGDGAGGLRKV